MGTTICSIHVYSQEPVAVEGFSFQNLSHGWQTCLLQTKDFHDPETTQKTAKKISKNVNAPVLLFCVFDEEYIFLKFYICGKQVAVYCGDECGQNKNLYKIPGLIGIADGQKRRLSKILSCSDTDYQIKLLEEYFGVCLMVFPELCDDIDSLFRTRSDVLYKEYIEKEKALTGKRAAVQFELVQEVEGILYNSDWGYKWFPDEYGKGPLPHFKEHYYIHVKARITGIESTAVHFCNGEVRFVSDEEMRRYGADKPYPHRWLGDNDNYLQEYNPGRLVFSETSPDAYAGKEWILPRGFYGLGFNAKKQLVIYDGKNTVGIVDESLKIIAKHRLKGDIYDVDGNYILTVEEKGLSGIIRVYRIRYK